MRGNTEEEEKRKGGGVPLISGLGQESSQLVGVSRGGLFSRFLSLLARGRPIEGIGAVTVRTAAQASPGGLAALMTGRLGAALVGLLFLGSTGALLYNPMGGSAIRDQAGPAAQTEPGPVSSGIRIRDSGKGSLDYLSGANQGQVIWDPRREEGTGDSGEPGGEQSLEEAKGAAAPDDPFKLDKNAPNAMAADLAQRFANEAKNKAGLRSGFKFGSSSFGGGGAGSLANSSGFFGGKGGFGSLKSSPKLGKAAGVGKGKAAGPRFGRGAFTAMAKAPASLLRGTNVQRSQVMSGKAAKQLGFAAKTSAIGAGAGNPTAARGYEAAAFDQNKTTGGTDLGGNTLGDIGPGGGIPTGGGGIINPVGGTGTTNPSIPCPGGWVRDSGGICMPPDCPPGQTWITQERACRNPVNRTPYQGLLDSSQSMISNGNMMLLIGAALIAAGIAALHSVLASWIGWALIIAGTALVAMGLMMFTMAKSMGSTIGRGFGQEDQQAIIDSQAQRNAPPPAPFTMPGTRIRESTNRTRREIAAGQDQSQYTQDDLRDIRAFQARYGGIVVPTSNPYQLYRRVQECPYGKKPEVSNWPYPGDRTCVSMTPQEIQRAYGNILVPTSNPFQPYLRVTECPPGKRPERTDWPLPGDRGCF